MAKLRYILTNSTHSYQTGWYVMVDDRPFMGPYVTSQEALLALDGLGIEDAHDIAIERDEHTPSSRVTP